MKQKKQSKQKKKIFEGEEEGKVGHGNFSM